jgi:SOS-response transcriptional repressor LexA
MSAQPLSNGDAFSFELEPLMRKATVTRAPCPPIPPTARQRDCLAVIIDAIDTTGIAPSLAELMAGLDAASKSTVFRLLDGLEDRGWIRREHNKPRAITVLHRPILGDVVIRLNAREASELAHVVAEVADGSCPDPCELGDDTPCTQHLARTFLARWGGTLGWRVAEHQGDSA